MSARPGTDPGSYVRVEDRLAQSSPPRNDPDTVLDLIYQEAVARERLGERPSLDEYVARFPALESHLRSRFPSTGPFLQNYDPAGAATLPDSGTASPSSQWPAVPGYEVQEVLGRGGMGVVYKARHLALHRDVALKMILSGSHASPVQVARFRLEAEAVARLSRPNIVQGYEVGEHDGHPYLALEYADGGSLAQKVAGVPLPAAEAARLVEVMGRAVQHAHDRGVVHRDLKPHNVLLTRDGAPKITDFGLAS